MKLSPLRSLLLFLATIPAAAQMSSTYRQAADAYDRAAAQCQDASASSCMRENASYCRCLANQLSGGGACSRPTCSTSCTRSSSASTTSSAPTGLSSLGSAGGSPRDQLAQLGGSLLYALSSKRLDKKAAEAFDEAAVIPSESTPRNADLFADPAEQPIVLPDIPDPPPPPPSLVAAAAPPAAQPSASTPAADTQPAPPPAPPASPASSPVVDTSGPPAPLVIPPIAIPAATTTDEKPDPAHVAQLEQDLLDDPAHLSMSDLWQGMQTTGKQWATSLGDLMNAQPLRSLAQALGLQTTGDPVQDAASSCAVGMLAGGAPAPAGGLYAAYHCMTAAQDQGFAVLGLANDQMGQGPQ